MGERREQRVHLKEDLHLLGFAGSISQRPAVGPLRHVQRGDMIDVYLSVKHRWFSGEIIAKAIGQVYVEVPVDGIVLRRWVHLDNEEEAADLRRKASNDHNNDDNDNQGISQGPQEFPDDASCRLIRRMTAADPSYNSHLIDQMGLLSTDDSDATSEFAFSESEENENVDL